MEVPETARKRQMRTRELRAVGACLALLCTGLVAGCTLDNPGVKPPAGVLSYPVALALGKPDTQGKARVLYVVNSNFDLRYNAGSVHAYDLDEIARAVEREACEQVGVPEAGLFELPDAAPAQGPEAGLADAGATDASSGEAGVPEAPFLDQGVTLAPQYEVAAEYGTLRGVLCDGLDPVGEQCCFKKSADFLVANGELLIDSYAAGMRLDPEFKRLYLPMRGRDKLLYVDTDDTGALSCGTGKGRCTRGADDSDRDLDPDDNYAAQPRGLTVGKLSELVPMSMAPEDDRTFIATVHETGEIALLVDEGKPGPVLHSVIRGFDPQSTSVTLHPGEQLLYTSSSVFGSAILRRYGVTRDGVNERWLLYPTTSLQLSVAGAFDIRDLRVDDTDPMRLFALMRGVAESVLFVERDPTRPEEARVTGATRVGAGPSKLTRGTLGGRKLLFASCFDAKAIFVIDEATRELISVLRGLSGPFEMVVDEARERMYVADFRANVLRVIDVKGLSDSRLPPPRIIATLGKPSFGGKLE